MIPPPETTRVTTHRVACDGAHDGLPASLGHPRVWLEIDETGYVDCGYCDRRFVSDRRRGGQRDRRVAGISAPALTRSTSIAASAARR